MTKTVLGVELERSEGKSCWERRRGKGIGGSACCLLLARRRVEMRAGHGAEE